MSPTTIDLVLSSDPGEPAQVSAYNANTLILSCSGDASFFDSLKAELHTSTNLGTALADVTIDPIPAGDGPHDFEFSAAQMNRLPANFSGTRKVYCLVVRGVKGSGASVVKTTLWIARLTLLSAPAGDTPPPPPPSVDIATQEELDALTDRVEALEDNPPGSTNLSTSTTTTTVTVVCSSGTDAVLPGATDSAAGVMTATQVAFLASRAPSASPTFTGPVTLADGGTFVLNDSASTFACIISCAGAPALTANRNLYPPDGSGILATTRLDNGAPDRIEVKVKCDEAGGVTAGQAVYIYGAHGSNKLIRKAQASTEAASSKTIGIVTSALAYNGFGYVITEGDLTGLSISAPGAAEGDPIWLSPTVAGGLVFGLANKPTAPNHMVFVGYVLKMSGSTVTEVFVKVQNGFEVAELHDVQATAPAEGMVLFYRVSSGLWVAAVPGITDVSGLTAALAGKASTSHTHSISDVTGLTDALAGKASTSHTHAISDVTGLTSALAGKASTSHTHAAGDVTSGTFAAARLGEGTPTVGYVLTLSAALVPTWTAQSGGAAWGGITGTLSNQTDLQNALNAKANASHTHTISQVTDATTAGQNVVKLATPAAAAWLRINTDGSVSALGAADTRTALGLQSMAEQTSGSVSITGGSLSGISGLTMTAGGVLQIGSLLRKLSAGYTLDIGFTTLTDNRAILFPNADGVVSLEGHSHDATDIVSGTLNSDRLANSGVTVGTYTNATITVDAKGRVTSATNGSPGTGSGDVVGPASSTNNGFARFDGTTGKLLKDSAAVISITEGGTGATSAASARDALGLGNTGVTPGTYTNATVTVDALGRVSAATSNAVEGSANESLYLLNAIWP